MVIVVSITLRVFSAVFAFLIFAVSPACAEIVLEMDFEAGTGAVAGDLTTSGILGTPTVGGLTATGGFISGTRPAWTSGSNGAFNNITVNPNGSFNDVGTPAGNYLTATLLRPAAITGGLLPGQVTTVNFTMASFGTNNATAFKYSHILGLSSTGQEVFQLLYRAGNSLGVREAYAREFGQDNTTFSGGAFASVEGTKVVDDVQFFINSTNTDASPSGQHEVSVVIDSSGWGASFIPTGGGSTQTPATNLSIASGATDLASIVFFSSQNASVSSQNSGLWVDNLFVETPPVAIPEPSSAAVVLALAFAGSLRRRR